MGVKLQGGRCINDKVGVDGWVGVLVGGCGGGGVHIRLG